MLRFFVTTHFTLLLLGLLLLIFYAKTGYKIDQDVFDDKRKNKVPTVVKVYSIILLLWITYAASYFFLDLLRG